MATISAVLYSVLGLGGLAALIWVVRSIKQWGNAELEKDIAEKKAEAGEIRNEIEDNVIKLSPLDKRLRLKRWAIQTDKADE